MEREITSTGGIAQFGPFPTNCWCCFRAAFPFASSPTHRSSLEKQGCFKELLLQGKNYSLFGLGTRSAHIGVWAPCCPGWQVWGPIASLDFHRTAFPCLERCGFNPEQKGKLLWTKEGCWDPTGTTRLGQQSPPLPPTSNSPHFGVRRVTPPTETLILNTRQKGWSYLRSVLFSFPSLFSLNTHRILVCGKAESCLLPEGTSSCSEFPTKPGNSPSCPNLDKKKNPSWRSSQTSQKQLPKSKRQNKIKGQK